MTIISFFQSLLTGFVCGVVFSLFQQPIPAPMVFEGIIGIVGIWLGFVLVKIFIK